MNNLPIKLKQDPIIDAIIEIRFDAGINANAVFGMVYAQLKDLFPGEIVSLQLSQMPLDVVVNDLNLRYKPLFKIDGANTSIQMGPHMIAVNSHIPYVGWDDVFFNVFNDIVNQVFGTIGKIERLGLRYINFFEQDIQQKVDVEFKLAKESCRNFLIRAEVENDDDLVSIVQYTPNATVNSAIDDKMLMGSIIDIDTSKNYINKCEKDVLLRDLQRAHSSEKDLFFSLLKQELLEQLGPIY